MSTALFFCDATGRIIKACVEESPKWAIPAGARLWEALGIEAADMPA